MTTLHHYCGAALLRTSQKVRAASARQRMWDDVPDSSGLGGSDPRGAKPLLFLHFLQGELRGGRDYFENRMHQLGGHAKAVSLLPRANSGVGSMEGRTHVRELQTLSLGTLVFLKCQALTMIHEDLVTGVTGTGAAIQEQRCRAHAFLQLSRLCAGAKPGAGRRAREPNGLVAGIAAAGGAVAFLRFVDLEGAAVKILTVQRLHRTLGVR
jgi:hypothetical protein